MPLLVFLLSWALPCKATVDVGVGTSSFTAGRAVPALALGFEASSWSALYRSVGVRTPIYAQNAWLVAGHMVKHTENLGAMEATLSAGVGAAHFVRAYRNSPASPTETQSESAFGPHLAMKVKYGPVYLGFDTLLGLTSQIPQHLVLNFQDLSHVTLGISL